jgi:hypothetical protein
MGLEWNRVQYYCAHLWDYCTSPGWYDIPTGQSKHDSKSRTSANVVTTATNILGYRAVWWHCFGGIYGFYLQGRTRITQKSKTTPIFWDIVQYGDTASAEYTDSVFRVEVLQPRRAKRKTNIVRYRAVWWYCFDGIYWSYLQSGSTNTEAQNLKPIYCDTA